MKRKTLTFLQSMKKRLGKKMWYDLSVAQRQIVRDFNTLEKMNIRL